MAESCGEHLSPQAQFLLFCRLGLGTIEEVLQHVLLQLEAADSIMMRWNFQMGRSCSLTDLFEHQEVTVLQLPERNRLPQPRRRPRNGSRTSADQSRKGV